LEQPAAFGLGVDVLSLRPTTASRLAVSGITPSMLAQAFPVERFAAVEATDSGRVLVVKKRHNKISQNASRWL
jgi:hypothetical protein